MPAAPLPSMPGQSPSLVAVRRGDVVGVTFPGEELSVLFVPASGDMLLCRAEQWTDLQVPASESADAFNGSPSAVVAESVVDASASELTTMLAKLGASVA